MPVFVQEGHALEAVAKPRENRRKRKEAVEQQKRKEAEPCAAETEAFVLADVTELVEEVYAVVLVGVFFIEVGGKEDVGSDCR